MAENSRGEIDFLKMMTSKAQKILMKNRLQEEEFPVKSMHQTNSNQSFGFGFSFDFHKMISSKVEHQIDFPKVSNFATIMNQEDEFSQNPSLETKFDLQEEEDEMIKEKEEADFNQNKVVDNTGTLTQSE